MDISMPELNGVETTHALRRESPNTQVLVLTMHASGELAKQLLSAGARGYILKSDASRDLLGAIDALHSNRLFFTPGVCDVVLSHFVQGGPVTTATEELTRREREILQLLAEGKTNKEVATLQNISVRTAETHRANLMQKLGLHSAVDVVRYAVRNRIIEL